MLATHFVRAALEGHVDVIILASRDTDLAPAVEMAFEFGKSAVTRQLQRVHARLHRANHSLLSSSSTGGGLEAGCGWPVRTLTGCFVRALAVLVLATRCGVCGLPFVKPCVA
jgi:hypothetical protein